MKLYYKLIGVVFVVALSSEVYASQAISSYKSVTVSDLLSTVPKVHDTIKPEDLESEEYASLLNVPIPPIYESLLNPTKAIKEEIALNNGGKKRIYLVEHLELYRSHWTVETKTRLLLTLGVAYLLGNGGLTAVGLVLSPVITYIALIATMAGGGFWYLKSSASSPDEEGDTKKVVLDAIEKTGGKIKSTLVSATSESSVDITLASLLREKNMSLTPTYAVDTSGIVRCIYEGFIPQSYGGLLHYRIVLRPTLR